MVGLAFDLVGNPLGAVRATFEKSVAASGSDDPAADLRGKDWGAIDVFRSFLFDHGGLSQVPFLDPSNLGRIKPNTLVRFRGMVQDMFGDEYYIGVVKDGSTWRTNKFTDVSPFPQLPSCESQLWARQLFHCIPVPGQNSWTTGTSPDLTDQGYAPCSEIQQGEKRQRDEHVDITDVSDNDQSASKRQAKTETKEDGCSSSTGIHEEQRARDSPTQLNKGDQNIAATAQSCLVKVYDMQESGVKLNDVVEFIGVYTFDPELVVHKDDSEDTMLDLMEDLIAQLPPSKVPRLHCLIWNKLTAYDFISKSSNEPEVQVLRSIRQSLLSYFTMILGNDSLAAQYVLLHLLSKLQARVDGVMVGKLSLNLTNLTRESAFIFGSQINKAVENILPYSQTIPLTVDYLNTATFQPKKDNQIGRLMTGILQLPQGTHLTFDETCMKAGTLNARGVENATLLKNLMELQSVNYDFEYYKLEMATDVRLLVLSEGKSNILPADLVVPFRPTSVCAVSASTGDLESWRWYLATVRSLPQHCEPSIYQIIQDEMVLAMKEDRSMGSSELSRWLTMAQIMAASFGETSLSLEHWQMVKELERLRKERL